VTDEEALYTYVLETIGDTPNSWPGGWPGEIEAALIDAIFSIRARYGSRSARTGVYGAVVRWQDHRGGRADDLASLAATSEPELRAITNAGKLAGRTKAQVVLDAAKALVESVSNIRMTSWPERRKRGRHTCPSRAADP